MAESVSLTAQAQGAIRAEVTNAIIDVLGQSDPNRTFAAAQDIVNLENTISRKFKTLTDSIASVANKIGDLRSSQDESARQNAGAALAAEEQVSPLSRMANTLDDIFLFLQDKFASTGLGSVDANVGMLSMKEGGISAQISKEEKEKETKDKANAGSIFVSGTLAAATLMAIKDYLEETWVGLAQRILKPFVAVKLAIGKLPSLIKNLSTKFPKLTKFITDISNKIKQFSGKVWTKFASKFPNAAKKIQDFVKVIKNFKVSNLFAPLKGALKSVTGGVGFGLKGLFKFMSPVLTVFKKLALPITLVLEAFEAFKMIFVGSFTKNAQDLSDSISEKGILGRAWYGFTHMFQTIATFGYELVETFKAVIAAAATFLDPVVEAFHSLTDTISNMFIDMYNTIARNSMGLIKEIPTEEARKMTRRDKLIRTARGEDRADKLIDRGAKVGVKLEDGDDFLSFTNKIYAAEQQKKRNEKVQLAREVQKPEYGVGRYQNQQNIQQNSIQNNTTFEVQMPKAGEMLDQ